MLFSELKCKDVINLRDCRKLGHIADFEFDECTGCICRVIVPGSAKWKSLFGCDEGREIWLQGYQTDRAGHHHRGSAGVLKRMPPVDTPERLRYN